jgi:hypothetical protein
MIANAATVLIGLWLVYRAVFSAGDVNQVELIVAGGAVVLLALWARRTDRMNWHSSTNVVLAVLLVLLGIARWTAGVAPLVSFWMVLLIANAAAVIAMWALLYRPRLAQAVSAEGAAADAPS